MRLRGVAAADLPTVWRRVEAWLSGAVARVPSDLTLADLHRLCEREEAALVLICGADGEAVAAGVTQAREHPDGRRSCWILALGGAGARDWRHTLGTIEANAARIGREAVEFVGRLGWARLLPDYACAAGFRKVLAPAEVTAA